ncbi:ABC transporter substrate-binding protein, partial [Pseudomonas syringae pv. tagetis]
MLVCWGGWSVEFLKDAWATPFSMASGISVVQDGPT